MKDVALLYLMKENEYRKGERNKSVEEFLSG
jgi:hypothetical protein